MRKFDVDFNYQENEGEDWLYGVIIVHCSDENDVYDTLREHYNGVEIIEVNEIDD